MDHFKEIYAHHAADYERLVAREDYQHNLYPALDRICTLSGLDVVELGAGTGRLTCLLAPVVNSIQAFDASQAMLDVATAKLKKMDLANWRVEGGDNRNLPLSEAVADVSIAGWSLGHFVGWYPDRWRAEIGYALAEMQRVLWPGGTAIILETLGTGFETPTPPNQALADYYNFLENEQGFSSTWIRTDYQFASLEEAEALTRFFFGEQLAHQVVANNWVILPECTGIWWQTQ
jgi:ubiquinone/menaquinone biosynthesis C-methylase UbiE